VCLTPVVVREMQSGWLVLRRFPRSAIQITSEPELMASSSSSELFSQNSSVMSCEISQDGAFSLQLFSTI
jgi:hypothetical protein